MESEMIASSNQKNGSKNLPEEAKQNKPTGKSLNMAMLGKNDLLRLLSILEGELEARDIYITTLQAQVNKEAHVKGNYFYHSISDPFLALMRDNEAVSGSVTPSCETNQKLSDEVKISPLPLLEKVVNRYKKQQEKIKQHLALSDAYYNMVNDELFEEKKRGVSCTTKNDTLSDEVEKEKEKLRTSLNIERSRTKRIAQEYNKLLQLIGKERVKYRVIITMLLNERQNMKDENSEPVTDSKLNAKVQELMIRNGELENSLLKSKENEARMTKQVENLFQQAKILKMNLDLNEVESCNSQDPTPYETHSETSNNNELYETPLVGLSGTISTADCQHQPTAIKRSSSVIEKRSSHYNYGRRSLQQDLTAEAKLYDQSVTSRKFKMLPTMTTIVSSPTSGAANFALNSPNQPHPSTPFPVESHSTAEVDAASHSSQFEEARQMFQQIAKTSSAPSAPVLARRPGSLPPKRSTGMNNQKDGTETHSLNAITRSKSIPKRMDPNSLTPIQTPKPPKGIATNNSDSHVAEQSTKIRPPPLPPKKANLLTKQSSTKLPSAKFQADSRKPGMPNADKGSRLATPKISASKSSNHNYALSRVGSARRPTSLNTNNSSNRNNRTSGAEETTSCVQPTPPGYNGRLSAQQRLFPSQDGFDGQLRSPITNTVPKSPIGSNAFTFK